MTDTLNILTEIVSKVKCKPGWQFRLQEDDNGELRLVIRVASYDSATPDELRRLTIDHYQPIPKTTYNRRSWLRWLFEQCRRVENHELGEWFRIDSDRPFSPLHGPGEDPYTVHEFRPEVDALTTQDGSIRKPYGSPDNVV